MSNPPILYSFRRCPYAMRARLAFLLSGRCFEWREILLRDKPSEFLAISSDGTVPVLQICDNIIQESLEILKWALADTQLMDGYDADIIAINDGKFKAALDRYKYANRHPMGTLETARANCAEFMIQLDEMLDRNPYLHGPEIGATDLAILPFIRQFAHVDLDWFAAQNWPNLSAWLENFKSSALFEAAMVKLPPWKAGDTPKIYGDKG